MRILLCMFLTFLTLNVNAGSELRKVGTAIQLFVDGKPMLVLGGEVSNSAVTNVQDIKKVMRQMAEIGHNTVFVPAYWDLLEPEEGHFDYTLTDSVISEAKKNNLKVVFLWFGAWKNSMSCYAPLWFKKNTRRFPRAFTADGKQMEIASAFSENVLSADKNALSALMHRIDKDDPKHDIVVMMQVENEIGMLESARDHSHLAEKTFLKSSFAMDQKSFSLEDEERFQAEYYAKYVEVLAKTVKNIIEMPVYVNAALNSRGRKPGEYPSAGPLAHLFTVWRKYAPDVDIFAPDIYDEGFKKWVLQYKVNDNPFFTPETKLCDGSGVRAMYVFGEVDAIGYSTFAIDQNLNTLALHNVNMAYGILNQLQPIILANQGKGNIHGLLFTRDDNERVIKDGDIIITCRHYLTLPWDPRAKDGSLWPETGGLIIKLAPDEYLIAGCGIVASFQTFSEIRQEEKKQIGEDGFMLEGKHNLLASNHKFIGKRVGIGYVDQVSVDADGTLKYIRRDNGDQDHQGRHARISIDDYKILHIKLYDY